MKITIITPTYHTNLSFDQGYLLAKTIESVIYQEGDFELEYIIMDGGSTDSTLKVIKKYDQLIKSKKFKPNCKRIIFKWFSEPDNGQSQALNKGFKIATGEVTNWLCSHDLLLPGALQLVSDFFIKNKNAKVVYGAAFQIDEKGDITRFYHGREFTYGELIRRWDRAGHKFYMVQGSIFYKLDLVKEMGYLDEKNHLAMDYDLWLKFRKKHKFFYITKPLSSIRHYSEAKNFKYSKEQFKEIIKVSKRFWGKNHFFYRVCYYYFKFIKYPVWKLFKRLNLK